VSPAVARQPIGTSPTERGGWTEERIALLTRLWNEGLSASRIAVELGRISRNGVLGKAHRLGLVEQKPPSEQPSKIAEVRRRDALLVEMARAGRTAAEIVECTGRKATWVYDRAKQLGLRLGKASAPTVARPVPIAVAKPPKPKRAIETTERHSPAPRLNLVAVLPAPRLVPAAVRDPLAPTAEPITAGPVTLLDLRDCHCRWPLWPEHGPERTYCGGPADLAAQRPYCARHASIAYAGRFRALDPVAGEGEV
jgi:GcrA cell cycle regulator